MGCLTTYFLQYNFICIIIVGTLLLDPHLNRCRPSCFTHVTSENDPPNCTTEILRFEILIMTLKIDYN